MPGREATYLDGVCLLEVAGTSAGGNEISNHTIPGSCFGLRTGAMEVTVGATLLLAAAHRSLGHAAPPSLMFKQWAVDMWPWRGGTSSMRVSAEATHRLGPRLDGYPRWESGESHYEHATLNHSVVKCQKKPLLSAASFGHFRCETTSTDSVNPLKGGLEGHSSAARSDISRRERLTSRARHSGCRHRSETM
jgi:hypothetical protein